VEIGIARKRLEALRDDLDKSIVVLQAEHPRARGGEMEAGDAGANLTEADRNEASVTSARAQRAEVTAALEARPTTTRCVACQNKRDRRRR
jgi:DnaK suppressor protein